MDRRLPWFRAMSAENRSWLGLVAQAGVAAFVDWIKHPERARPAVAGEVFGTAPRELARAVSLQQAVEMVRVIIDVVEAQVDELAAPGGEAELREAVLRYTREIAFGAGPGLRPDRRGARRLGRPAGGAGRRLAGPRRGGRGHAVLGVRAELVLSPVRWSRDRRARADGSEPEGLIDEFRMIARRSRLDLLAGVHGNRLVVVLGGAADPLEAAARSSPAGSAPARSSSARPSPTCSRPSRSAGAALAGLRAAHGWPDAPRPGAGRRPAARAGAGRRRVGPRRQLIERGLRAAAARRHGAARHRDDLPGAGQLAGGDRPAAVRAPEYRPVPAAPGHRADRDHARVTAGADSRCGRR